MEQAGYSPSFKKPADIMRMRRKRARSEGVSPSARGSLTSLGLSVPGTRPFSPGPLLNAPNRPGGGGQKRRNPFANIENTYNSPKKRATVRSDGDVDVFLNKKRVPVDAEGENSADYANKKTLSCVEQLALDKTSEKLPKVGYP